MIKNFLLLSLFFFIINCTTSPGTAFLGPVITGVKSGSIYQTSLSYGSNKAIENIKTELRLKKENFSKKKTNLLKKIQDDLEKPSILLALKIESIEVSEVVEPEPLP
tara:strand:- start:207 stop:527 length:321 start_codon:yes stop_codon:yes gene_type:complete